MTQLGSMITVRLTRENFLLWKAQAVSALRAANLFGYVDGSIVSPPATITQGSGKSTQVVASLDFLRWFQQIRWAGFHV
jgi:hypothetical protein